MKTRLKKGCMKTAAIFVTVVMLFSIVKIPVVYAYFTAKGESETLTFVIVESDQKSLAYVSFINNFLIDENKIDENEESSTGGELTFMTFGVSVMNSLATESLNEDPLSADSLEALLGEDRESIEDKLSAEQIVQAEIRLEDGFDPGEIYVPSVELHYGENSASALSGELNDDGALVVDFDRELIASWFEKTGEEMEHVTFTVTGEGYVGGLDRFLFSGEASIKLKGSYETRTVAITGSDAFFIPAPGETIEESYLLVNQDGVELEGARWGLDAADTVEGAEIDLETGSLTVYSNAVQGAVTIIAAIELEGRLLTAQKTVELYEKPELAISGADNITIPLPGKTAVEQYAVEPPEGFTFTNISWELLEDTDGISIDETGLLTVAGEAAAEGFTLVARIEVEGVSNPLILKKEVLLEAILIGSIEITGTELITIPDREPYQEYYQALVYDPEGNELEGETVSWSLENGTGTAGVSLNEEGILLVEPHAAAGDLTLLAASVRNPEVAGRRTVTLQPQPQQATGYSSGSSSGSPVEEDENRLVIKGPTLILIPSGEATKTYTYTAADIQGNPLERALFALLEEYEGVTLSENGELTVDSSAVEGEIFLLASCREEEDTQEEEEPNEDEDTGEEKKEAEAQPLTGELRVTLALPAPAAVQINGAAIINIPVPDGEGTAQEVIECYSAVVLDQEGNLLESEGVTWSLAETAEGILFSEMGELRVTSGASAGTVTIIATSVSNGEVYGFFEAELFEVDLADEEQENTVDSGGDNTEGENNDDETPPGKEEDPPALEDPPGDGDDGGAGDGDADEGDEEDTPDDEDTPADEDSGGGDLTSEDEENTGGESNQEPAYVAEDDGGTDDSDDDNGAEDDGDAGDGSTDDSGADGSENIGLKED